MRSQTSLFWRPISFLADVVVVLNSKWMPVHGPSLVGCGHLADVLPQPRAEWTFDERQGTVDRNETGVRTGLALWVLRIGRGTQRQRREEAAGGFICSPL
jgi:hypothetical protein